MSRILHVLDHSLPLHSGYTFRTRAIMKAQAATGWDVVGLTGVRQYQHGEKVEAASQPVEGLTFHRTMAKASGPSPLREWREVTALTDAIVELHHRWPFELIHAHSPALNGLAAVRASQRLGVALVYEIRAYWEDAAVGNGTGTEGSVKYRLTRALENHVIRQADAVAVICDGLRRDLIGRGVPPNKIVVSPNGVDLDLFGSPPPADAALAAKLGLSGKQVIGYIGSFYDYEGLDDLIAAMPLMRSDAQLLLVGGGPMEAELRAQSKASSVARRIHFVGRVPHDEVERYYGLVDILAYPRKRMRLTDLVTPLKPLEAMAQGRLVAASDVGGHKELIRDGDTGILFAADDPAAIARSLDSLLADRAGWDAMRARARKFVEAERSWQKNIYRYDPVYHLLLGETQRPMPAEAWQATMQEADMRTILPDNQMRAMAIAMAGAVFASVATMFVPAGVLESLTGSTGLSEIFVAAKAPLSDTARAVIAFGAGALTLAVLTVFLLRSERAVAAAIAETSGDDAPSPFRHLLTKIEVRKLPWVKVEDDITELSDLPKLKRSDSHPDAPPRTPLSAHDLPMIHSTENPDVELSADMHTGQVPVDILEAAIVQPVLEPAPVVAPKPASGPNPSLADMVAQLEAAVTERKKQLADLEMVAAQLGKGRAAEGQADVMERAVAPQSEAVPANAVKNEPVDAALAAALATLHRMNDGVR